MNWQNNSFDSSLMRACVTLGLLSRCELVCELYLRKSHIVAATATTGCPYHSVPVSASQAVARCEQVHCYRSGLLASASCRWRRDRPQHYCSRSTVTIALACPLSCACVLVSAARSIALACLSPSIDSAANCLAFALSQSASVCHRSIGTASVACERSPSASRS